MKNAMITFRSVTPAQRGEKLLEKEGVSCTLRRTPRWMQEQGCGYSLQVRHQDVQKCAQLLQENRIAYRKVYLLRDNGTAEELSL